MTLYTLVLAESFTEFVEWMTSLPGTKKESGNEWRHCRVQNKNPTVTYEIRQFTSYQGCRFSLHSASSFIQTGLYKGMIAGKCIFIGQCWYNSSFPIRLCWLFFVSLWWVRIVGHGGKCPNVIFFGKDSTSSLFYIQTFQILWSYRTVGKIPYKWFVLIKFWTS